MYRQVGSVAVAVGVHAVAVEDQVVVDQVVADQVVADQVVADQVVTVEDQVVAVERVAIRHVWDQNCYILRHRLLVEVGVHAVLVVVAVEAAVSLLPDLQV